MPHIDKDEPLKGHPDPETSKAAILDSMLKTKVDKPTGPSPAAKIFFGAKVGDPSTFEHTAPSATGSKIPEIDKLRRIRAEIQRISSQNAAENPHRKNNLRDLRRLERDAEDEAVAKLAGQYNINVDPKTFDLDITTKENAQLWNRVETDGGRYQVIPGYENHTIRYDSKLDRYVQPNLDGPTSGYHEFTPDKATLAKFEAAYANQQLIEDTDNYNQMFITNPKTEVETKDKTQVDGKDTPGDKTQVEETAVFRNIPHTNVWDGHRYTPNTLRGEKYVERHGDYATHKGVFRTDIRGIPRFQRWDEDATKQRTEVVSPILAATLEAIGTNTETKGEDTISTAGDTTLQQTQEEATVNPTPETASLLNVKASDDDTLFLDDFNKRMDSFNNGLSGLNINSWSDNLQMNAGGLFKTDYNLKNLSDNISDFSASRQPITSLLTSNQNGDDGNTDDSNTDDEVDAAEGLDAASKLFNAFDKLFPGEKGYSGFYRGGTYY